MHKYAVMFLVNLDKFLQVFEVGREYFEDILWGPVLGANMD